MRFSSSFQEAPTTSAWLKESWAVYVEKMYMEDMWSQNDYLYGLYDDAISYFNEADNRYHRPIVTKTYDSSWAMYDMHLYPGGSWRLHMLRREIGDEKFLTAVRDYLNTYRGKLVETIDFRRKLEEHSGLNLEEFFDQDLL